MAIRWRVLIGVVAVLVIGSGSASAFQDRLGWRSSSSSSYYYVPAYSYYYCPPVRVAPVSIAPVTFAPVPSVPLRSGIYAVPSAAPPSQTTEPPLAKPPMPPAKASDDPRLPLIVTARSDSGSAKDLCRVGFWNLSGRDRTLTIEGKSWTLPKDRTITLDVDRRFAWQLESRAQRLERVPDGQATHDVVIRD